MTIEEKRRELFEVWWKAEGRHRKHQGIINGDEEIGFELWCAALDAVVIDIRKDYFPGSDNMGAIVLDKNYSRFAFLRIIEDTGLGIKVKS